MTHTNSRSCQKKKGCRLYVLIMSHMCFRVNSYSSCLNVKEILARSRPEIWSLSDCNWTRTHSHLVHKQTLNHLAKLVEWLSVSLWTKWLWVRVQLQSLKAIDFLAKIFTHLIEKSPLSSFFARCLRCLSPVFIAKCPDASETAFKKVLSKLVNSKTIASTGDDN